MIKPTHQLVKTFLVIKFDTVSGKCWCLQVQRLVVETGYFTLTVMNSFTDSDRSINAACQNRPYRNNQYCHLYCLFTNVNLFLKSVYVPVLCNNSGALSQEICQNITSKFDWVSGDTRTEKIMSTLIWAC